MARIYLALLDPLFIRSSGFKGLNLFINLANHFLIGVKMADIAWRSAATMLILIIGCALFAKLLFLPLVVFLIVC